MRPGEVIGGRLTIEHLAGAGGMGTVYRAHDAERDAKVALKLLQSEGASEQARFAREARVLSELDHPGVVRYVAHGLGAAGEPYLAMEWLEGLAGAWLEQAGEGDPATLAEHFARGEDRARAAVLYARAMKHAVDASNPDAILAHAERAIVCGAEGPLLGESRVTQADAHLWRGELAEAQQRWGQAIALLPGSSPLRLKAASQLAVMAGLRGDSTVLTGLLRL
jgi:hypothetical protein